MPSGMLTPPSHSYETASVFAPEKRVREGTFYLFPVTLKKLIYILWKKIAGIGVNRGGERKKTEDLKKCGNEVTKGYPNRKQSVCIPEGSVIFRPCPWSPASQLLGSFP